VPRPMNAFLLFRQHYQGLYKNKKLRSAVISKRAAEKWKKLSKVARDVWFERAHALAEEHKRQYPDYQFKPDRTK
ncbi:high mobility group box domain-containing protein, partial [Mucidula mucida]